MQGTREICLAPLILRCFSKLLLLLQAKQISVVDTSGGCGAMYEISIQSSDFVGVSRVNQHRMITDTLKEQIKNIHGLRIQTTVPDSGNGK